MASLKGLFALHWELSRPLSLSEPHTWDFVLPSKDRKNARDLGLYSISCLSCFYGAGAELHTPGKRSTPSMLTLVCENVLLCTPGWSGACHIT